MPTYVYKFIDSGDTIEVAQAFTDPTLTEARHPVSGKMEPVRKVFTPVGVTFKGNGFYKTDNRGSGVKRANGGSGDSSSSSTSTDGGSSSSSKESTTSSSSSSSTTPSTTTTASSG